MTGLFAAVYEPLVVWLYGSLAIGSLIMLMAWGHAALVLYGEHGEELAPGRGFVAKFIALRWCRSFTLALGLTEHATAMLIASVMRTLDILMNGVSIGGSWDWMFVLVLLGLADSKRRFVWAGSADTDERYLRWPWWVYVITLSVWGVLSIALTN